MDLIRQMKAQRAALGLDTTVHSGKPTEPKVSAPPPTVAKVRKSLKEMREDIIKKKPAGKKLKKYFEEAIERLTAESSDDDDI